MFLAFDRRRPDTPLIAVYSHDAAVFGFRVSGDTWLLLSPQNTFFLSGTVANGVKQVANRFFLPTNYKQQKYSFTTADIV